MARSNLELVSEPIHPIAAMPVVKSKFQPMVLSILAVVLAVAWGVLASTTHDRGLDRLDEQQIERAQETWSIATANALATLSEEVKVLVDDARVREPLATPNMDDATLLDVLEELKASSGASIVGILTPQGTVRVVAGNDSMRGLDLSSSSLMKQNGTGTWVFPDRMVGVALAPVRLGETLVAHLMVGRDFAARTLTLVEKSTGVFGAVVYQQNLVVSSATDPSARTLLQDAGSMTPGQTVRSGSSWLTRTAKLDETSGARVVFLLARRATVAEQELGAALWWAPAGVVFLGVILFWGFERRRAQ